MRRAGKKSLVGGIVALSLILTGIGYAYWTDTLNVTTKATTGELSVKFADLGLHAQYTNEVTTNGWSIVDGVGQGYVAEDFFMRGDSDFNKIAKDGSIDAYQDRSKGYNQVEFDAELVAKEKLGKDVGPYVAGQVDVSNKILLTVENMYPGYAQVFRTDILNVGSIAARLSNMKFDVSSDSKITDATKNLLGIAVLIEKEESADDGEIFALCKKLAGTGDTFTVGKVQFLRLSALEKLTAKEISAAIKASDLLTSPESQNRMDLYVAIAMDPDAKGDFTTGATSNADFATNKNNDADSQNSSVKISIDLLWDQFNVGVNEGNGNWVERQNGK